jgi:hypothetical protein
MNIKKLFLIISLFMAASTADSFAQLTKTWDRSSNNFALERLCTQGKLAVVSRSGNSLIDLTDGNIITSIVNPNIIILDNSGKRYFLSNHFEKTLKVYDRYTNEFIQDLEYNYIWDGSITAPDDSTTFDFDRNTHTLIFRNIYLNGITDSCKLPNTPDEWTFDVRVKPKFSFNGRYFACHVSAKLSRGDKQTFIVYDRQTKEIIFSRIIPDGPVGLVYSFMHTTNQMVFGEVIKLEVDDKPYSYICIFDLDKREIVRNIKVGEEKNGIANLAVKTDDNYLLYMPWNTNNTLSFYNFKQNLVSNFVISPMNSVLLCYDKFIVTNAMDCYTFDWNLVSVDDDHSPNSDTIIYPNPTTNTINLNIEPKYYNGKWEIINTSGKIMLNGSILPAPNFIINIEMLPAQTYYLKLQKDNFTITYNVIKL